MSKQHNSEMLLLHSSIQGQLLHYGVKGMKWSKGRSLANDGIDVEDTEVNGVAYDDEAIEKIEAELAKEKDPAKRAELQQALAAYKLDREASVAMAAYAKAKKSGDPDAIKSARAAIDRYSKNIAESYDKGTKKSSSTKKEEEKKGRGGSGRKSSGGSGKKASGGKSSSGGSKKSSSGGSKSSSSNTAAKEKAAAERAKKAKEREKAKQEREKKAAAKKKEAIQKKLMAEKVKVQREKDKKSAEAAAKKKYEEEYKKAVAKYKEEQDAINDTLRREGRA